MQFATIILACATMASPSVLASMPGLKRDPNVEYNFACIKTQPEYTSIMPQCAQYCHALALTTDGCKPDDHICHCKNTSKVAGIIEPCIFGPNPGPAGPCSTDEINEFAGTGKKYCTFWNQTADDATKKIFKKNRKVIYKIEGS